MATILVAGSPGPSSNVADVTPSTALCAATIKTNDSENGQPWPSRPRRQESRQRCTLPTHLSPRRRPRPPRERVPLPAASRRRYPRRTSNIAAPPPAPRRRNGDTPRSLHHARLRPTTPRPHRAKTTSAPLTAATSAVGSLQRHRTNRRRRRPKRRTSHARSKPNPSAAATNATRHTRLSMEHSQSRTNKNTRIARSTIPILRGAYQPAESLDAAATRIKQIEHPAFPLRSDSVPSSVGLNCRTNFGPNLSARFGVSALRSKRPFPHARLPRILPQHAVTPCLLNQALASNLRRLCPPCPVVRQYPLPATELLGGD